MTDLEFNHYNRSRYLNCENLKLLFKILMFGRKETCLFLWLLFASNFPIITYTFTHHGEGWKPCIRDFETWTPFDLKFLFAEQEFSARPAPTENGAFEPALLRARNERFAEPHKHSIQRKINCVRVRCTDCGTLFVECPQPPRVEQNHEVFVQRSVWLPNKLQKACKRYKGDEHLKWTLKV
jgi:hypothetical protein